MYRRQRKVTPLSCLKTYFSSFDNFSPISQPNSPTASFSRMANFQLIREIFMKAFKSIEPETLRYSLTVKFNECLPWEGHCLAYSFDVVIYRGFRRLMGIVILCASENSVLDELIEQEKSAQEAAEISNLSGLKYLKFVVEKNNEPSAKSVRILEIQFQRTIKVCEDL